MAKMSTGSSLLDGFLEGGYETDILTTIYGPAGSGKTTLALIACISVALRGGKIVFVDTEGGVSLDRLKQLTPRYKEVLDQMIFLKPTNLEEQKKIFEQIKKVENFNLLVVDTMTALYRLMRIKDHIREANDTLANQINNLLELTRKKEIPILMTNQVYTAFEDSQIKMIGGDLLAYSSKCIIELQNFHKNKRKIILKKHRSIAGEKEIYFQIVDDGISPA
ncbi:DNA repair and recombination protein RadB [Candidatus Woesearchaeota archaeon]|nr:DNA repair and recombination protein RadB [Candidatus Woesearchaeota archaeon]